MTLFYLFHYVCLFSDQQVLLFVPFYQVKVKINFNFKILINFVQALYYKTYLIIELPNSILQLQIHHQCQLPSITDPCFLSLSHILPLKFPPFGIEPLICDRNKHTVRSTDIFFSRVNPLRCVDIDREFELTLGAKTKVPVRGMQSKALTYSTSSLIIFIFYRRHYQRISGKPKFLF